VFFVIGLLFIVGVVLEYCAVTRLPVFTWLWDLSEEGREGK